jgi:hypothetical protein
VPQERVVLCMKWGTLYSADYVNVLYSAVRSNLAGPFRFVCLTDDPTGINPSVETFPIPDIGLEPSDWRGGGWPKLSVFKQDLFGLTGRALFIDLDTVVAAPIDEMFDQPGELVVIDTGPNWKRGGTAAPPLAGTGIFAFNLGGHAHILETFMAERRDRILRHRIEQAYVQAVAPSVAYWPAGWVVSFKYHLRRAVGLGLLLQPRAPSTPAKIVAFHGKPRPTDLITARFWGIPPHLGRGPVGWMLNYWTRNLPTVGKTSEGTEG